MENFDINNADAAASGSSNQVEIKTEPEESDEKDVNKKRPSEDKEGNASKKQKTNEEHGEGTSGNTLVTVDLMMKIHDNLNKLL